MVPGPTHVEPPGTPSTVPEDNDPGIGKGTDLVLAQPDPGEDLPGVLPQARGRGVRRGAGATREPQTRARHLEAGQLTAAGGRLEEAARLFRKDKSDGATDPDWGRAETQAWIGLIHLDQGNVEDAGKALRRALKIDEEYDWVKTELLPRADELAAGGS